MVFLLDSPQLTVTPAWNRTPKFDQHAPNESALTHAYQRRDGRRPLGPAAKRYAVREDLNVSWACSIARFRSSLTWLRHQHAHSSRSAAVGSSRAARRTGSQAAASAT